MDGFNEKKWFVYLTDHHEGPFSLGEIQDKMAHSQVTLSNFVWAEGMSDWKAMTEIAEFEAVLNHSSRAESPAAAPAETVAMANEAVAAPITMAEPMLSTPLEVSSVLMAVEEKTGDLDPADLKRATAQSSSSPLLALKPGAEPPTAPGKPRRSPVRAIKWGLIVLIPAGITGAYFNGSLDPLLHSPAVKAGAQAAQDFAQPYLLKLTEKFPALGKWISPLPALEDVSPEDYEALKTAAMQKLQDGAKVAVAHSSSDLFAPVFYVATNLPDGAVIDVYVEGIPDTLLNQLSFSGKVQATISKKLGKTGALHFTDGKPLPRGEYVVYATESAQQPDAARDALANIPPVTAKVPPVLPRGLKLLVSKPVFLGGNKDATYESRLKDFHDKLRAKATAEITEIKQLQALLDTQLDSTNKKFAALKGQVRKGKASPGARKAWGDFNKQWGQLDAQLKESFAKWTPQALSTEYFYGSLYQLVQQAGLTVEQVHQLHADYFDGKTDPRAFEIQLPPIVSTASTAMQNLKTKIEQVEKLPPTPNGMPRREEQ